MPKTKHTPGPFEVQNPMGSDVGLWIVQAGLQAYEWSCIAIVPRDDEKSGKHFITKSEQDANANLFAASPELLQMLKHAVHWHDQLTAEDVARYEAVIAKAEGRA